MSTLNTHVPLLCKTSKKKKKKKKNINKENPLNYCHLLPDQAPWSTISGSNYPYPEQIAMVPKMFKLLKFDCIWQHSLVEAEYEIFSTVFLSLPLIQEGQLSVSGKRMLISAGAHLYRVED